MRVSAEAIMKVTPALVFTDEGFGPWRRATSTGDPVVGNAMNDTHSHKLLSVPCHRNGTIRTRRPPQVREARCMGRLERIFVDNLWLYLGIGAAEDFCPAVHREDHNAFTLELAACESFGAASEVDPISDCLREEVRERSHGRVHQLLNPEPSRPERTDGIVAKEGGEMHAARVRDQPHEEGDQHGVRCDVSHSEGELQLSFADLSEANRCSRSQASPHGGDPQRIDGTLLEVACRGGVPRIFRMRPAGVHRRSLG